MSQSYHLTGQADVEPNFNSATYQPCDLGEDRSSFLIFFLPLPSIEHNINNVNYCIRIMQTLD